MEKEMESIFDELSEEYDEEVDGACEYWHLAQRAHEEGHRHLAANLRDISAQEMHHARYLRDYLTEHGHFDEEKHREAEEGFRRMLYRLG